MRKKKEGSELAIYHLRVKYLKRSAGRSAVAAAAYRSGTRLEDARTSQTHDYTRKKDIEHSEVLLPDHMPPEMLDRRLLWKTVEMGIKRKDGQPAFEVEVALPRELSREQCAELVREFSNDMFVARGVPVDFAIHRPTASDGGEHPHAHILIGTRRHNPDGSLALSARDMQDNPKLVAKVYALEEEGKIDEAVLLQKDLNLGLWRREWEDYSNRFLADGGSEARIDHRTLEAQQVAREPTPNVGFAFYEPLRAFTGHLAERLDQLKAVNFRNAMREQMERIREKAPDTAAEFIAHARQYGRKLFPELGQEPEPEREQTHER